MSTEGVLFYGFVVDEKDPGWRKLMRSHSYIDQALAAKFGDDPDMTQQILEDEFGCKVNIHGDAHAEAMSYYVTIAEAEHWGGFRGAKRLPRMRKKQKWDAQLRKFCQWLGIRDRQPGWLLTFWSA